MKIGKKFNTLSLSEYRDVIKNHKRYSDFNPLGLYRSILENQKLDTAGRQQVLALTNAHFAKFYGFLIVKDFYAYVALSRLGEPELSTDEMWQYIARLARQGDELLKAKKIRHHRVGTAKSERVGGIDDQGNLIWVQIMNKRPSQKRIDPAHIPHLRARKHKAALIRQALTEIWRQH